MNYLDTSVIVAALIEKHPNHSACASLIHSDNATSCHALAETFAVLTGAYKVRQSAAAEMIQQLPALMTVTEITRNDYLLAISDPRIFGGGIYDAIHATVARRLKADSIVTYNLSNFLHAAPDVPVVAP